MSGQSPDTRPIVILASRKTAAAPAPTTPAPPAASPPTTGTPGTGSSSESDRDLSWIPQLDGQLTSPSSPPSPPPSSRPSPGSQSSRPSPGSPSFIPSPSSTSSSHSPGSPSSRPCPGPAPAPALQSYGEPRRPPTPGLSSSLCELPMALSPRLLSGAVYGATCHPGPLRKRPHALAPLLPSSGTPEPGGVSERTRVQIPAAECVFVFPPRPK